MKKKTKKSSLLSALSSFEFKPCWGGPQALREYACIRCGGSDIEVTSMSSDVKTNEVIWEVSCKGCNKESRLLIAERDQVDEVCHNSVEGNLAPSNMPTGMEENTIVEETSTEEVTETSTEEVTEPVTEESEESDEDTDESDEA